MKPKRVFDLFLVVVGLMILAFEFAPVIAGSIAPVPCPATISGILLSNPSTTVTANLVPATQLGTGGLPGVAWTPTNAGYDVGLLAVYQVQGGYTAGQVGIGGFGGTSANTWGLLSEYHYNYDGSCTSYNPPPPPTSSSTTSPASTTSTSTNTATSPASTTSTAPAVTTTLTLTTTTVAITVPAGSPSPRPTLDPLGTGIAGALIVAGISHALISGRRRG